MAPSIEKVVIRENQPEAFKKTEVVSGPSPYAHSINNGPSFIRPQNRAKPLVASGVFKSEFGKYGRDISPLLGVDYSDDVQVADFITTFLDKSATPEARKKAEDIIRDIAIQVSRKGVVVFRHQHKLTVQNQKDLIDQFGALTGRPKQNGLHIHPLTSGSGVAGDDGLIDPEVSLISSNYEDPNKDTAWPSSGWHSDISFEPVPSDYAALKVVDIPAEGSGGDTLYANGYALYERFSKPFQQFLESLTAFYPVPSFVKYAEKKNFVLYSQTRGAPENVGSTLTSTHPVVRTNPVTGWKGIYGAAGLLFGNFPELSAIESQKLKEFIHDTLVNSHDLQVRISWTSDSDLVIWDNRSVFHTATRDYRGLRRGVRAVSIGERPYFDANSGVQSEAIYKELEEEIGSNLKI